MKKKSNYDPEHYFNEEHEEAILKYCSTDDPKEREELYIKYLKPVFCELCNKIIYTYKFTTLPNVENLSRECQMFIITILPKFDPSKKSKAFSYFSVVIKNWFISQLKINQKMKKEVDYADLKDDEDEKSEKQMDFLLEEEFWKLLMIEIEKWKEDKLISEDERKILISTKILFDSIEELEIWHKKSIFLYTKEITGLTGKQMTTALGKLRKRYKEFKNKWDSGRV